MSIVLPDLLTRLDHVTRIPSVSATNPELDLSNRPIVECLAEYLEALGFSNEIVACETPGKVNLIATRGSGPGGLVLAGHTDTVPYDGELWSADPFKLTERDGRLYGLGITDMKGFFPIAMEAILQLGEADFKEPLIVLATADEETSMEGAKTLAAMGRPRARAAVIGEPTGLKPVSTHKGILMDAIRLVGQSGHSSDPSLGRNALDGMHQVISSLLLYREGLKKKYANPLFDVPYPTLNLGSIHGGDNPNRICGHCELQFDVRLMPGMNLDTVRAEIAAQVKQVAEPLGLEFELVNKFSGVPAFQAQESSALLKAAEKLTGHSGISVAFGTEGPYLQELGMDTIIMGPGHIEQAHQPDEYMSLDMIEPTVDVLKKLIVQHCIEPANGST
jgi:acetylornithine deacetylase